MADDGYPRFGEVMLHISAEQWARGHWRWRLHDFWTQIAVVALLKVLHESARLHFEVMPMIPPWENPPWQ